MHDNNDADVPGTGIAGIAPAGVGIGIAGGQDNVVRGNLITNQKHQGVSTFWLFTPPMNNQIIYNTFKHVGYGGLPGDVDVAFDMTSLQNCASHNVDVSNGKKAPASMDPPNMASLQDCDDANPVRSSPVGHGIYEPGDPVISIMTLLDAVGITEPKDYKGPGPRPDAMNTMANPCQGVPANPWCSNGEPRFAIPIQP